MKHLIAGVLLTFALGSLLYRGASETLFARNERAVVPETPAMSPEYGESKVTLYFFDTDKQCTTCDHLKEYAAEAIQTHFSSQLESGKLAWRTLNLDDPENEHFITEFNLYSKSVVVVRAEPGAPTQWKNLEAIWELVYDKPAYIDYIRTEVQEFLGEDS